MIICLCISISTYAQRNGLDQTGSSSNPTNVPTKINTGKTGGKRIDKNQPKETPKNDDEKKPDDNTKKPGANGPNYYDEVSATGEDKFSRERSAYYANVVKRYGWYVGIGTKLTPEQAKRLNCYYKLSQKNRAGNWCFVEAFNGYGNATTAHNLRTYLVDPDEDNDYGANYEWKDKLKTVCKWQMVADASGKNVVQEKGLASDSSVVFIMQTVPMSDNEVFCSYTDQNGIPAYFRDTETEANTVHIIRDNRGYDVLLNILDKNGAPQQNMDGAYMTRKEYDDNGNVTKSESLNIIGERMNDKWGNCGALLVYQNDLRTEARLYDADLLPVRIKDHPDGSETVFGYRYEYDQYGRLAAILHIDANGNPDINQYGVHKICYTRNEHGKVTRESYYDLNDNLHANDSYYNIAERIYDFDERGRLTSIEYKDDQGNYVNSSDDFCKKVITYKDDIQVELVEYVPSENGKSIKMSYEAMRDSLGNMNSISYTAGVQRIDSVDIKGRDTLCAYYNLDGSPNNSIHGWHKYTTVYDDANSSYQERWTNSDGLPYNFSELETLDSCSLCKTYTDSVNHIWTYYQFQNDTLIKNAYKIRLDDQFDLIQQQWDITPYGEHARVGWDNTLYYDIFVNYTYGQEESKKNNIIRNEFGEPAYLRQLKDNDDEEAVYYLHDYSTGRSFDEYSNEIQEEFMSEFIESLPRVYCIEVTDTTIAYPLGLRNGDIIINYGDWNAGYNLKEGAEYFYLETILQADKSKSITLLRHHPERKSSEILSSTLPVGKTSDLGFYPHMIYYTQREANRLRETCSQYGVQLNYLPQPADTTVLMAMQEKESVSLTSFYHNDKNRDPGLVLYVSEQYSTGIDFWSFLKNSTDEWDSQNMFNPYFSGKTQLFLTHDFNDIQALNKNGSGNVGLQIVPIKVTNEVYQRLLNCYASHSDEFPGYKTLDDYRQESNPSITTKKLRGRWNASLAINEEENILVDMTLDLNKKHKANVEAYISFINPLFKLDLKCQSNPSWTLDGVCLDFSFDEAQNACEVMGVQLSEDGETILKDSLTGFTDNIKNTFEDQFSFEALFLKNTFIILEVNSDTMVTRNGNREIIFKKVK